MLITKRPRYGIDKVIDEIEDMFLNNKSFHNRMYQVWLGLSEYDRAVIRKCIKISIRENLLGKEWWVAISKDIIQKDGIVTGSFVYRYLKARVFNNDMKKMFIMLRDVREDL